MLRLMIMKLIPGLLIASFIFGCQGWMMHRKYTDVSGKSFMVRYAAPKDFGYEYRYIGKNKEYHILDCYTLGGRTIWLRYDYSIRAKRNDLPVDFPGAPQPIAQGQGRLYKEVSGKIFIWYYDNPKVMGYEYHYYTNWGDSCIIDCYSVMPEGWLEYRYSVRANKKDLPIDFPDHPWPGLKM